MPDLREVSCMTICMDHLAKKPLLAFLARFVTMIVTGGPPGLRFGGMANVKLEKVVTCRPKVHKKPLRERFEPMTLY